jgi:protein MpaA
MGHSIEGRPIIAHLVSAEGRRCVLILAGVHGDEPKGVNLARRLLESLDGNTSGVETAARAVIVPVANPDGYAVRHRRNARGVDINRNFPTSDWRPSPKRSRMHGGDAPASEPETLAIMKAVRICDPCVIVSIHSIGKRRFCNNYDGPGRRWALQMARFNGYPVRASMGYPTPGSLGAWAGRERRIPTITLELPSHHSSKQCWQDNRAALLLLLGIQP